MPGQAKPQARTHRTFLMVWRNNFVFRALFFISLGFTLLITSVFAYFYVHYAKIVDARIRRPIFNNTARIYAAPELVRVGWLREGEFV